MALRGELSIPPPALADENAREMVRAWAAGGNLHCTIYFGCWGDDERLAWGILLSDLARHVADALFKDKGVDRSETIATIVRVFDDELKKPENPDVSGYVGTQ